MIPPRAPFERSLVEVAPTASSLELPVSYRIDPDRFSDKLIALPLPSMVHTFTFDRATIRGRHRDYFGDGSFWNPLELTITSAGGGYNVTGRIWRTLAPAPPCEPTAPVPAGYPPSFAFRMPEFFVWTTYELQRAFCKKGVRLLRNYTECDDTLLPENSPFQPNGPWVRHAVQNPDSVCASMHVPAQKIRERTRFAESLDSFCQGLPRVYLDAVTVCDTTPVLADEPRVSY